LIASGVDHNPVDQPDRAPPLSHQQLEIEPEKEPSGAAPNQKAAAPTEPVQNLPPEQSVSTADQQSADPKSVTTDVGQHGPECDEPEICATRYNQSTKTFRYVSLFCII
jgi:hypothetical protein